MRNGKSIAAALLLMFFEGTIAHAQTAGTVQLHGPSSNPALPLVTPEAIAAAVNAGLAGKVDATGGVLTNPTVSGNLPVSGNMTVGGGLTVVGSLSLGALNLTATTGLQFNGVTGLYTTTGTAYQEGVFLGRGAGDYFRINNTQTRFGMLALGTAALQNLQSIGAEAVAAGQYSCRQIVSGFGITCVGQSAISWDPAANYQTFVGNDAARDTIGNDGSTGIGASTQIDGTGSSNTTQGAFALTGNAGSIKVTGTPVAGDILRIGFATTNIHVTGLPATVTYTVPSAATNAIVATGIANAILGQLSVGYVMPNGNNINTEIGVTNFVGAAIAPVIGEENIVGLHFPGGAASGWAITPTILSCTGTCTEVLTVSPPFSGTNNIATGNKALHGIALTSGSYNDARGDNALANLAGSSAGCMGYGYNAGYSAASCVNSLLAGFEAAQNATSITASVILAPFLVGPTSWQPTDWVIIGAANSNSSCFGSGVGGVSIGFGDCPTTGASSSWPLSIQTGAIAGLNNNKGGGGPGGGQIGIEIASGTAMNATFTISDYGGAALWGNHIAFNQAAAPVVSGCTGCTVDAQASDVTGTLTEGTTQTGAVITFSKAFNTTPHCAVSSPTGSAITSYTPTTTTLTIVNPSLTAAKYTWACI